MTLFRGYGFFASSLSGAAPGMVLMKPTSIAHSGTSATLGANGQVTFTAVTELNINGCFTADFDNYMISIRHVCSSGGEALLFRLRASGSDASGTNYTRQRTIANGSTVSAQRETSQTSGNLGNTYDLQRNGHTAYIYGPYLAQPTAARTTGVSSNSSAMTDDYSFTHSLSTAYDGFTFYPSAQNITGAIAVYGIRS